MGTRDSGGAEQGHPETALVVVSKSNRSPKRTTPARSDKPAVRTESLHTPKRKPPVDRPALKLPFKVGLAYTASLLPGGLEAFLDIARMSNDAQMIAFFERYDSMTRSEQQNVVLDDICRAVGYAPKDFIGEVARIGFDHSYDISRMMAAFAQPAAVQAMALNAADPDKLEDRKMLFQVTGLLPKGGGTSINVQANANAKSGSFVDAGSMPTFEQRTSLLGQAIRGEDS